MPPSSSKASGTNEKKKIWQVKVSNSAPTPSGYALLPICIRGGDYNRGEKLSALIKSLQGYEKIIVLISGILYRKSLEVSDNLDPEAAAQRAYDEGEAWLAENLDVLQESAIEVKIVRWEDILGKDIYSQQRIALESKLVESTYEAGRLIFDQEADQFLKRLQKKRSEDERAAAKQEISEAEARSKCIVYLKEECAVLVALYMDLKARGKPYSCFVYPNKSPVIEWALSVSVFGCKVSIYQPELVFAYANPVTYYAKDPKSPKNILHIIKRVDEQAIMLADYGTVHANGLVFFCRGASAYTRNRLETSMIEYLAQARPEFELFRESSVDSSTLFFMPHGMYPSDKFSGDAAKKYMPKQTKIAYGGPEKNPVHEVVKFSCVINLTPYEALLINKMLLVRNFMTPGVQAHSVVYENVQLIYSYFVFKKLLPPLNFSYLDGENYMYATFPKSADRDNYVQLLINFFKTMQEQSDLEELPVQMDVTNNGREIEITDLQAFESLLIDVFMRSPSALTYSDGINSGISSLNSSPANVGYSPAMLSMASSVSAGSIPPLSLAEHNRLGTSPPASPRDCVLPSSRNLGMKKREQGNFLLPYHDAYYGKPDDKQRPPLPPRPGGYYNSSPANKMGPV